MKEDGRLSAANRVAETLEQEKYEAEEQLFTTLLYRTILNHLDEREVATITGAKVLNIIEQAKEAFPPELILGKWQAIHGEVSQLRRKKLMQKRIVSAPATEDIKEITEELIEECKKLNKNAKRHISFLRKSLTTRIFPGSED